MPNQNAIVGRIVRIEPSIENLTATEAFRRHPDGFSIGLEGDQIVRLSTRDRIPTVFPWREYVIAGGLLSYGTSLGDTYRQAAGYVARILKGAKPADLPAQRPSKFEVVLNLRAAKALGLTIPPLILLRADEVIE